MATDWLPMLVMSLQGVSLGSVGLGFIKSWDDKYKISSEELEESRLEIEETR